MVRDFRSEGTPAPIVKRIFDVTRKTMQHPDVLKRFDAAGTRAVVSRSPEDFRAFVKEQTDSYAAVIKAAGIATESALECLMLMVAVHGSTSPRYAHHERRKLKRPHLTPFVLSVSGS